MRAKVFFKGSESLEVSEESFWSKVTFRKLIEQELSPPILAM